MKTKKFKKGEFKKFTLSPNGKNVRSYELARKMLPVIIAWAKAKVPPQTYGTLAHEIGHDTAQIGHQLYIVDEILNNLQNSTNKQIPQVNGMIISKNKNLPGDGFVYVYDNYDNLSDGEKEKQVSELNREVYEFKEWDWVMDMLGLDYPTMINKSDEEKIRGGKFGIGGEGEQHKKIKEFIYNNPKSVGILDEIEQKSMEYGLLSGDRLDVYFKLKSGEQIAIEVKPKSSADDDILRGLFQCVKYKAVLDAENRAKGIVYCNRCILVLGGELSESNRDVCRLLGVNTIMNFKIKNNR